MILHLLTEIKNLISMINVIHITSSLAPESGGPARSVPLLCRALSEKGLEVCLLVADLGEDFSNPLVDREADYRTILLPCRFRLGLKPVWIPGLGETLSGLVKDGEQTLIHDHGVWLPRNGIAAHVASRQGIPLVVSTRGMLEPWALAYGRWRKKLAWHFYQKRWLKRAEAFHATSRSEFQQIRMLGLQQFVEVVPNGTRLPDLDDQRDRETGSEPRKLLFLSRIHPKKGLLNLVKAMEILSPDGWQVIVAGYDEGGHHLEVESAVEEAGLKSLFRFVGPVGDEEKWQLYREADLFVLPSHSENFGIVVAEALASAVPVITTKGTPWQDLETHRCGWWVEDSLEGLVRAMREALNSSRDELKRLGRNGRELAEKRYSWQAVATDMVALYQRVLGI